MDDFSLRWVWVGLALAAMACGDSGGSNASGEAGGSGSASSSAEGSNSADGSGTGTATTAGTGSATGSGSEGATGIMPGTDCESATDCVLDDDCCHCSAYPELPPGHGCAAPTCEQTVCESYGVTEVECVAGHCVPAKVECDPSTVVCDAPAPQCEGLEVPSVAGGCWTGACVPIALCTDAVYFNCDECGPSEMCVRWGDCLGDSCSIASTCASPPRGCDGMPACGCGGDAVCAAWGFDCYDEADGFHCCKGDSGTCESAG